MVTEYVPGRSFRDVFIEHRSTMLYLQVVHMIKHLQDQMQFTHYDLHPENIIVDVTPEPTVKIFVIDGTTYTMKSPYTIKFIDFGFSYIPGLEPAYYPGNISYMLCPGIYDPLVDYGTFIRSISFILGNFGLKDTIIINLFADNLFYAQQSDQYNRFGSPIAAPNCLIRQALDLELDLELDYLPGNWATNSPCNRNIDDILAEYDAIIKTPEIIDTYTKLISGALVHYRLEQMKLRKSTPTEFYKATLQFIKRYKPQTAVESR